MKERVQIGISTMHMTGEAVAKRMAIAGHNAFFIDQCDREGQDTLCHEGSRYPVWHSSQRGLSRSRNLALSHAQETYLWLCDDDVCIDSLAEERILSAFAAMPKADALCCNVVSETEGRPQHLITEKHSLKVRNAMRYPTYRFVWKTEVLKKLGVQFDEQFGSGATYSSGEDSLFTHTMLKRGCRIVAVPVEIGRVRHSDSQWFSGYTDKYLFDKGALFAALFGFALPYCAYMLLRHPDWREGRPFGKALALMQSGARTYRRRNRSERLSR